MTKQCFKCLAIKERTEFYKHNMMADGLLGKCKECTKRDVMEREERLKLNPEWVALERERNRIKQAEYRKLGKAHLTTREAKRNWELKNKHKKRAQVKANRAMRRGILIKPDGCEMCNVKTTVLDKHHDDYSKPLDVRWLCKPCHGVETRKKTFIIAR